MALANPASHSYFSQRLRLHYLDWGNTDAPSLLFIHGTHDQCHSWDWMAQSFRSSHHLIVPDLRGHGNSEWSRGSNYSWAEYVYDMAQLIRQRNLSPVVLVGHSLGGSLASIYAGIYPDNVAKLVIVEGIGLYPRLLSDNPVQRLVSWIDSNFALAGRVPRRYPTMEDAFRRMQVMNPHLRPDQAAYLTKHAANQNEDSTYSWKYDNYTRTQSPYDLSHSDLIAIWSSIACPTLIINSDAGYPHRIGQDGTEAHFANAKLLSVANAGHWAHHDQLETVTQEVRQFFDGA